MAGYIGSKSSVTLVDGITKNGGTLEGDLSFGDNDKAKFGAGDDLQIYHDGSNSIIHDNGTGNLQIRAGNLNILNATATENYLSADNGGAVNLFYNNSKKFETTSTGIGVTGKATLTSGELTFSGSISDPNGAAYIWRPADNTLAFGTANEERMRLDASGKVGIGLTNASSYYGNQLVVNTPNEGGITMVAPNTGEHYLMYADGTTGGERYRGFIGYSHASNYMRFATDSSERMRLDASGNMLVGKASGGNEVQGTVLYNNGQIYATASGHQVMLLTRKTNNGEIILFYRDGTNVGNIYVTGSSTSYNTSSDYRLKENVVDLTGASARVNQLNPSRFNFIADADTTVDGFLAHEVADVVPEAITGVKDAMKDEEYEVTPATGDIYTPATDEVDEVIHSADAEQPETLEDGQQWRETTAAVMGTRSVPDYQGIDQSKLVPLLTAALQEALAEITSLKTRVQALEA